MIKLGIYFLAVGLIVLGSLGFIAALTIKGRIRVVLACLMAAVPILAGILLFHNARIRPRDLSRLVRTTTQDVKALTQDIQDARDVRNQLGGILERK